MSCRFFTIIFIFLLSSCYLSNDYDGLYDQVGTPPSEFSRNQKPTVNRSEPNYYYRYGPTVPAAPEYANQQYQYQYNQQGYAPYPAMPQQQQQQYAPYQAPASRFYSNPYDIPQASPYGNAYDSDQYYVPPSHYYNQEQNQYRTNPPRSRTPHP